MTIVVLEDGLTSSFNHNLRMTLESSIEDVMLGKFIFPEQSKMKANDFVTEVANEKRRLRSSRWLPWSSRMGWQVVSTAIFEWLLNLWLKMWTNYCVVAADNLHRKDKPSIKALSVTCFGLITCRGKVLQLKTGCPLRRLFEVTSLEKLKL